MTLIELFLLLGVAGCAGGGVSSVLSSMIDRIGRAPAAHRTVAREAGGSD